MQEKKLFLVEYRDLWTGDHKWHTLKAVDADEAAKFVAELYSTESGYKAPILSVRERKDDNKLYK